MKLYGLWSNLSLEEVQRHVDKFISGLVTLILTTDVDYFYHNGYEANEVFEIDLETGKVSTI